MSYLNTAFTDTGFLFGFCLLVSLPTFLFHFMFPNEDGGASIFFVSIIAILIAPSFTLHFRRAISSVFKAGLFYHIAFWVYAGLSLLWTNNVQYGRDKFLLGLALSLIPGLALVVSYSIFKRFSMRPFMFLCMLYIILSLSFAESPTTQRWTGLSGNPIWMSRDALLVIPACFYATKISLSARTVLSITSLMTAISTGSRGPLLSCFFAVFITSLVQKRIAAKHVVLFIVIAVLSFPTFYFLANFGNLTALQNVDRITSFSSLLFDTARQNEMPFQNTYSRYLLFAIAIDKFESNPIFGTGLGGFSNSGRSYPHNLLLEIFCELGLFGALLFLVALLKSLKGLSKEPFLLCMLIQCFLYSLVSGDLASNWQFFHVSFLSAIVLVSNKRKNVIAL